MSNSSPIIFDSDYEYVLGRLRGNVLNLQGNFGGMDWAQEELYIIAKELENTAKTFAEKQGLRDTGNLINSTHAKVENKTKVNLFNNARNPYGDFYAGHIEYGYHTRRGDFISARPFMRPALYAVADASRGELKGALARYLSQVVNGVGISGGISLDFGRAHSSQNYTRVFYQQQTKGRGASTNTGHYTSKGLLNSSMNSQGNFSALRESDARKSMSVVRGENESRFMTTRSTLDRRFRSDSTRKYGLYGTNPGRTGRPSEGKARISSGRPVGRPATGRKEYKPTGNPVGRPRTGRKQYYKPTGRKPTGRPPQPKVQGPKRPRGRPKIYSSPSQWPSRQRKYDKPGRPRKENKTLTQKEKIKKSFANTEWKGVSWKTEEYREQWLKEQKGTEWGKDSLVNPGKTLDDLYKEVKKEKAQQSKNK